VTNQNKPEIQVEIQRLRLIKPENFDLKRAEAVVMKLIRENEEWVKETAKK